MRPPCGERYAVPEPRGRADGARCPLQAYDRGMTESKQENTGQDAPLGLQPLPGGIELLDGDAAGYCSNGVCHIPAPTER